MTFVIVRPGDGRRCEWPAAFNRAALGNVICAISSPSPAEIFRTGLTFSMRRDLCHAENH
jgi:hypothetical protein